MNGIFVQPPTKRTWSILPMPMRATPSASRQTSNVRLTTGAASLSNSARDIEKESGKDIFWVTTYGGSYKSKTLIWATGSKYKTLGVPGEEEFKSRGVTYCSICDGPLFKGKDIVVVGAGNNGLTSAIYMATIAQKVYILNRTDRIRGDPVLFDRLKSFQNVEILNFSTLKKISGEKKVTSVTLDVKDHEKIVPVDGVIINVGYNPITEPIKNIVAVDHAGYLEVDMKKMTQVPGLFAAGDVVNNSYKQLVISASDGCTAALGAYDYLSSMSMK